MRKGWELGWFSLETRRPWEHLIAGFQYITGTHKKDGDKLFSTACWDRPRASHSWAGCSWMCLNLFLSWLFSRGQRCCVVGTCMCQMTQS